MYTYIKELVEGINIMMVFFGILWVLFILACFSLAFIPPMLLGGIIMVVIILFNLDIFIPIAIVVGIFVVGGVIYGFAELVIEDINAGRSQRTQDGGSTNSNKDDDPTLGGWY
jgi:hypothetical protein